MPAIQGVAYVMFRDRDSDGAIRTCTTLWPCRVDRSPCGTGSSVQLAALCARGLAKVGDRLRSRSIIDSEFEVFFRGTTTVAGRETVCPRSRAGAGSTACIDAPSTRAIPSPRGSPCPTLGDQAWMRPAEAVVPGRARQGPPVRSGNSPYIGWVSYSPRPVIRGRSPTKYSVP